MLKKITDKIYCLPYERENDRPNLYYILGEKYSLAIDAGNSLKHVDLFYGELEKKGLRKPSLTVITHWHWDHTFGIHAVEGLTIASTLTNNKLREVQQWKWNLEAMAERERTGEDIEFCNKCIQVEYENLNDITVIPADIEIEDKMKIDLGGVTCIVEHRDAPHSRDSLFIYVPEEKALIIGDADCEDHYENNGIYDKNKLAEYIKYIESINFKHYLIGHDESELKEVALDYLKSQLENCM